MRYRVLDLPAKGVGAFTPGASTNPIASSWGVVRVMGAPGTMPIPAPGPERSWNPGPVSRDPHTSNSNNSPDVILPAIYVAYADNMGPAADAGIGMATRRLAPLPVPALSWIRASRRAMITPKIGGRQAMRWPRAFQRFGNRNGGDNGA